MLKTYLITVVISTFIVETELCSIKAQLKREGLKIKKTKRTLSERILSHIYLVIPIYNIWLALAGLFKREEILKSVRKEIKDKEVRENG